MNSTVITATTTRADTRSSRLADYIELTKPRILVLVLLAVAAAGLTPAGKLTSSWLVLQVVLATGLIAASANVGNQLLERKSDAKMTRTKMRPLPSQRVAIQDAIWLMTLMGASGLV